MRLDEAVKVLKPLQNKSSANLLIMRDGGVIKSAIRTVFNRESATQEQVDMASRIEYALLHD